MFRIGEFSRLTRVTVKMLRHYDEIGLLAPSYIERHSGYRYYLAEQLPRLNRIIALKDLGFSLEAIAAWLDERSSAQDRAVLLSQRRRELQAAIERDAGRLRQLEALQAGDACSCAEPRHDVVLRAVAPTLMATLRERVVSLGSPVTVLFEKLETLVARHKARAAASPLMILHDEEFRETDLDVEVAVPLSREIPAAAGVTVRAVAGCSTMACVVYRGDYEQMRTVLQTLLAWTERHQMRIAGPMREVYLRFGADQETYRLPSAFISDRASDFVTEVQLPVEPRASASSTENAPSIVSGEST